MRTFKNHYGIRIKPTSHITLIQDITLLLETYDALAGINYRIAIYRLRIIRGVIRSNLNGWKEETLRERLCKKLPSVPYLHLRLHMKKNVSISFSGKHYRLLVNNVE